MQKTKTQEQAAAALAAALLDFIQCLRPAAEQAEPAPAKDLYSLDELAAKFCKKRETVRQWVCAGDFGEPVRVGKALFVTKEGYDNYIAEHTGPVQKRVTRKPRRVPQNMTDKQYKAMRI